MHYYIIQRQLSYKDYSATNKALADAENIINTRWGGAELVALRQSPSKIAIIINIVYLCLKLYAPHIFGGVKRRDKVLFFVPDSKYKIWLLLKAHKIKHFELIMFINDIEFLRQGAIHTRRMFKELNLCLESDKILVPNNNSKRILNQYYGIELEKMIPVGVWDYLYNKETEQPQGTNDRILFIGNLDKSNFIGGLGNLPLKFDLIGKHSKTYTADNINYLGKYNPDELPGIIKGYKWALVWDGDDFNGVPYYQRFNNPHKMGLYLCAGIPVIAWSQSGARTFIEEYKCGVTIDTLNDLKTAIDIDQNKYTEIKTNVIKVSKLIRQGYFLWQALDKI